MLAIEAGDVVGHIAKAVSIGLGIALALFLIRMFARKNNPEEQGQEAEKK